jgi:CRP/FNR family transcriptional regulator
LSGCLYCKARNGSVFNELSEHEIEKLDSLKHCAVYNKGDVVFKEDTYPRGLFCVNRGKIKLTKIRPDGRDQILHLAKAGSVMGYDAVLNHDKYSCTATALETSSLCVIPSEALLDLFEKSPRFALKMVQLFAQELKNAERTIVDISQKTAKERLAQGILLLIDCYGYEPDKETLSIAITRDELAAVIGTARETATRLLMEFKDDKVLELTGRRIKVLNHDRLLLAAQA